MNDAELIALMADREAFFTEIRKEATLELLKGRFVQEKVPNYHTVTFDDGSKVTFRFIDCVKFLLDAKMKKIYGRDSFLSYFEVIVKPAGEKAFNRVFEVKQVIQGVNKAKSYEKHKANLWKLIALGQLLGIDLTPENAWSRTYVESYKELRG